MSVGLLNKLDYNFFEGCVLNTTFFGAAEVPSAWCTTVLAAECRLTP